MLLIIAEKPSVAQDIVAALTPQLGPFRRGAGVWENDLAIVSHAIGHLVEIDSERVAPNGSTLPIIPAFTFKPIERTVAQFRILKQLIARNDVTHIVNACDAGREGELIFRLIVQAAGGNERSRKTIQRMWLQSMTHQAIRDSFASMRTDAQMLPLAAAAYSRMEADWLVGINASRALSQASRSSTSAGRVQTPTLAILVHRELEILSFRPVDYYEVHGTFGVQAGVYLGKYQNPNPTKGDPAERISDKAVAQAIVAKCTGHNPTSVTEETKASSQAAPRLFDLTTLQREGNKRFGLSANETLAIAQSLYEKHKALTYPRTSACTLPDDYPPTAVEVMQALSKSSAFAMHAGHVLQANWIKPADKKVFDSTKVTDHFAIIPTGVLPQQLSQAEAAIFELVAKRFIAIFYPQALYQDTVRLTVVQNERFKSTGRVLVSKGWLEVYGADIEPDEDAEEKLPPLRPYIPGEPVLSKGLALQALKTKAPKRYTEASLLSAMEHAGRLVDDEALAEAMKELGLGTPATRASIIERLLAAGKGQLPYVQRQKKNLVPTQRGIELITLLESSGVEALTSPTLTGDWEHKLLRIEKGEYGRPVFMREIAGLTTEIVASIQKTRTEAPQLKAVCPKCAGALALNGRTVDCQCGWKLWMSMASRPFSTQEVESLLATKSIGPLTGFISSKPGAKPFSATVVLDAEGKPTFSFEPAPPGSQPAMSCNCPKCGSASLQSGPRTVDCSGCGWRLWKTVASKPLTDKQIQTIISTGQLAKTEGFVSGRTGKKFAAALQLSSPDFAPKFVFE